MTTTVSSLGYVTDLNSSGASAAIKVHREVGSLFNAAFSRAEFMEAVDISMPVDEVKREDSAIVKSPDPE